MAVDSHHTCLGFSAFTHLDDIFFFDTLLCNPVINGQPHTDTHRLAQAGYIANMHQLLRQQWLELQPCSTCQILSWQFKLPNKQPLTHHHRVSLTQHGAQVQTFLTCAVWFFWPSEKLNSVRLTAYAWCFSFQALWWSSPRTRHWNVHAYIERLSMIWTNYTHTHTKKDFCSHACAQPHPNARLQTHRAL